jgi:hypothetical protein
MTRPTQSFKRRLWKNPKLRKYPARNESARDPYDEIADEAQARALDDLVRQPAGRDADSQYDEKAFTRYVHFRVLAIR